MEQEKSRKRKVAPIMEQEYLQMKHILFARENTAWKTWKDNKISQENAGKLGK